MRHLCFLPAEPKCGIRTATRTAIRFWARRAIPALILALACIFAGCTSDDGADADDNGAGNEAGGEAGGGEGGGDEAGRGTSPVNGGVGGDEAAPDAGDEAAPDAGDEPAPDAGDEPAPDAGDEPAPDAGGEPAPDAGGEPSDEGINLRWMVRALGERLFPDWFMAPALEGVEVCLIESLDIPCVYTDEQGVFELSGLPTNSELLLTFTKEDYESYLVSVKTKLQSPVPLPGATQPLMIENGRLDQAFEASGVVVDEDKGRISIGSTDHTVFSSPPGRLSLSIDPPVGDGPIFFDNNLNLVPDATGLSEEIVLAIFANLDEGEYVISWEVEEPEKMSCAISQVDTDLVILGLPADQPDAMRVKVRPGFVSGHNSILCTATADPAADAD